jgi:4-hydroxy-tetrahydrodipicolinate synthase
MELPVKGIIPPLITPMKGPGKLDIEGLEKLIEHLIAGGVHGLFILGTTGEGASLSYDTRKELIQNTAAITRGRLPIFAGITDTIISGSVEIAEYAAKYNLDGVVIAPPYYFPISQKEMVEYLENLIPELPLPFMMYNMPSCTKMHMSLETISVSKDLGSIGIKDSSGNLAFLYSLIGKFSSSPDFAIISGSELFLPETILHGGHGAVAGGANLYPRLFVELYNASVAKDFNRIGVLRNIVMQIGSTIYKVGRYESSIIKGIKCSLSVMDICNDYMELPLRKFGEKERSMIAEKIDDLNKNLAVC